MEGCKYENQEQFSSQTRSFPQKTIIVANLHALFEGVAS